jgi:hypothetical protein
MIWPCYEIVTVQRKQNLIYTRSEIFTNVTLQNFMAYDILYYLFVYVWSISLGCQCHCTTSKIRTIKKWRIGMNFKHRYHGLIVILSLIYPGLTRKDHEGLGQGNLYACPYSGHHAHR